MYRLCQWIVGEKKIHEDDVDETSINCVLDTYESFFNNMGFNPVVSVNSQTDLPILKIIENDSLKVTLFFERV
jgi:hypothetical protein